MSVRRVHVIRPGPRPLALRLLHDLEEPAVARPLVCVCDRPRPHRLGGMWSSLALYECRTCARKVVT